MSELVLVGRSSSHFTRTARIFALELEVAHAFRPVLDMTVLDPDAYGGNPALRVPVLVDERGPLFGSENICRELLRRSGKKNVVLRGESSDRAVANAEELTLQTMSTEVTFITTRVAGGSVGAKILPSIENCLRRLDDTVEEVLAALPRDRQLSFVETALFCLVTHLPFRNVMDVTRFGRLGDFCERFGRRASAKSTEYRFDAGA
jgi:glutathione S-transferase